MKKYVLYFLSIMFLLIGCSQKETSIKNPYEISIKNKFLSYYDTKENIPEEFNILNISIKNHQDINNNVLLDSKNKIRLISITDKNINTYNQISVGDNIKKIQDTFSYEYRNGNNYMVIFNGNSEEDPTNQNKNDNWIWINYITDGSRITQIQIYDVKYGREMR